MMRLGRSTKRVLGGVLPAALLALALVSPAAAETLLVQPDGKIVLAAPTSPEFGALARLNPDGSLDPSFGQGGFVIDQRTSVFSALGLQPDGRIVGAFGPGSILIRYLPDGSPDPSFAGGGWGGTYEPAQPGYSSPAALLVQPGGELVTAGSSSAPGDDREGWVRRYDAGGALLETAGRVPRQSGTISSAGLTDLLERPDGSLIGTGWSYGYGDDEFRRRPLLARFLPGSSSDFDPSFGGGAGLVQPSFPEDPNRTSLYARGFVGVAQAGDRVLAAGATAGTFLLARFDADGNLDPNFGQGGFVTPSIVGPGAAASKGSFEEANSWAEDLAAVPDGDVVVAGGTSQWSTDWVYTKMLGLRCNDCPQPLLARFDSNGQLDPGFGSGGILRLLKPDGSPLLGSFRQVTALADGKLLVNGNTLGRPFIARLNPDGSYDPSFGDRGLAMPRFPCSDQSRAELRRTGCLPSVLLTVGLRGLRRGRPALSLQLAPNLPWAAINHVTLALPRGMRPTRKLGPRTRITAVEGGEGRVRVLKPEKKRGKTVLFFKGFGETKELHVQLRGGSLRTFGRHRLRRQALRLRMEVTFVDTTFREYFESSQTLVRRVP